VSWQVKSKFTVLSGEQGRNGSVSDIVGGFRNVLRAFPRQSRSCAGVHAAQESGLLRTLTTDSYSLSAHTSS
jgi:hypothetical protein